MTSWGYTNYRKLIHNLVWTCRRGYLNTPSRDLFWRRNTLTIRLFWEIASNVFSLVWILHAKAKSLLNTQISELCSAKVQSNEKHLLAPSDALWKGSTWKRNKLLKARISLSVMTLESGKGSLGPHDLSRTAEVSINITLTFPHPHLPSRPFCFCLH